MNRWPRWALPILMIVASLALGAWWRGSPDRAFREPFQSLAPDRVDAITLVSSHGTLRYERRGDLWRQVHPYEHPSDPAAIRTLLATASDVAPAYRMALGDAPAGAGLSESGLSLELGSGKDTLARFRIEAARKGAETLRLARTFVVGETPEKAGAALRPFRLDLGPRVYSRVGQREVAQPA